MSPRRKLPPKRDDRQGVVPVSAVTEHLKKRRVPFEEISHERVYSSIAEARTMGIAADEVVKTLVLKTGGGHAIAVVPGSRRLDVKAFQKAAGDKHARLATEEELQAAFPGYELGAFPPIAGLLGVPAFVDPEVLEHETVVFAAGTQAESVKAKSRDLFSGKGVQVVHITREMEEPPEQFLR
jgi:Cys-tRNA(Pro) deacylase